MTLNNLTAMMFVVNIALKLIPARTFHTIDNQIATGNTSVCSCA